MPPNAAERRVLACAAADKNQSARRHRWSQALGARRRMNDGAQWRRRVLVGALRESTIDNEVCCLCRC